MEDTRNLPIRHTTQALSPPTCAARTPSHRKTPWFDSHDASLD